MAKHPVVINNEAIQAIYNKYIGENVEVDYIPNGEPEQPQQDFNPQAWQKESELVTTAFFQRIAPNWNVPIDNQEKFAASLSTYLSSKWPNGFLSDKIENMSPFLKTCYELGNCIKHGVDTNEFKMRPMQPEPEPEKQESAQSEAQPKNKTGKYTTST